MTVHADPDCPRSDQSQTIAFLGDPRSHGAGADAAVSVMETHISVVFLVGERAFKLKRAVKYPYIDASTAPIRLALCEKEVALNSRTAPDLYLGVRGITRETDGSLAFDGAGELVDAVVEMQRFDQRHLFDHLALEGALTPGLLEATALMIARFHAGAELARAGSGAANIAAVLDINAGGFATSHVFGDDEVAALSATFRDALARHAVLLDARSGADKVRLCHGDLHLRNIFLSDGAPLLFDCIDFNDQIATVDVLYDLAFLLMDLWHRDLKAEANLVMNRYLDATGDEAGSAQLPFLMAVRAQVRAHVTATQAETAGDAGKKQALAQSARSYFDLATALLALPSPGLVAIGGFSGSGKSTIAAALAPRLGMPPGARSLESDRLRKAMFGVAATDRLPLEAYAPAVSQEVYDELITRAGDLAGTGVRVVVNAVFDGADHRASLADAALAAGVPFKGIWLEADAALLNHRVTTRPPGPSDATVDVLAHQLAHGTGMIEWSRIDASQPVEAIVAEIAALAMG